MKFSTLYYLVPTQFNILQATFLDDHIDVEHAREHGHMHLSEVKIHMLTLLHMLLNLMKIVKTDMMVVQSLNYTHYVVCRSWSILSGLETKQSYSLISQIDIVLRYEPITYQIIVNDQQV
jgi:hypothetical protein